MKYEIISLSKLLYYLTLLCKLAASSLQASSTSTVLLNHLQNTTKPGSINFNSYPSTPSRIFVSNSFCDFIIFEYFDLFQ